MSHVWSDDLPIYRQLMNQIIGWILSGRVSEGQSLPSIRKIAAEFQINPLTVAKAMQELAGSGIVEKQRGVGLFVRAGARRLLLESERERFLEVELPGIVRRMQQLEIDPQLLLSYLEK